MATALATHEKIAATFRRQVQNDKRVRNAYLLVRSDKLGIDLNLAEGQTGEVPAHPQQACHLASVGKLFTSTLIMMLQDEGRLSVDDPIAPYLDTELMAGLHVYKGHDYSGDIRVKHLLQQTSGLSDVFFPLVKKMQQDPACTFTIQEALAWGKAHQPPVSPPGKKHVYNDTNYYLLGLIIEQLTQQSFHEAVHTQLFDPLGMENAYIHSYSTPKSSPTYPPAAIYLSDINFIEDERFGKIDYAGGGVVAPLQEYLLFMQALVNGQLVQPATLQQMIYDDVIMGFPAIGFNYGYGVWKPKAIPLLMPKKYFCWGCVGVTGAFLFYHPATEAYVIGTFNDQSYTSKALRFMLTKVIKPLLDIDK